jgi:branched-chain amino acid transport system substrate-binding protein
MRIGGVAVAAAVAAMLVAGCGGGSTSTSSSSTAPARAASRSRPTISAPARASARTSSCGREPGVEAIGTPIRLGAIDTQQPGTDFTDVENAEGAYFACVNANGGVKGHPIVLYKLTEATNPAQVTADATKLIQTDHVVGVSGDSSVVECTIDHSYWEQLHYYVIAAGIAPECYSTPNIADVDMGPRYSSDGAVQYVLTLNPAKIVVDQSAIPEASYIAAGPAAIAAAAGVPITQLTENVSSADPSLVALKEIDDAGPDGAVVLNFAAPEALAILRAAQNLGLEDRVKAWACSSSCDTDYLATALGPEWDGKLFVNAELTPPDGTNTPTMNLYRAIMAQYGSDVSGGVGSPSQMGFVIGEIAVHALESVKGPYTARNVNNAFMSVTDFHTRMLCQPWTFGHYPLHVADNEDYTVTPDRGKMVVKQGCTPISSVDPQIAAYRQVAGG